MNKAVRTVFLGTGGFAVPTAEMLLSLPAVDLVTVVTAPVTKGSRGRETDSPVGAWARLREVPTIRPIRLRSPEAVAEIERLRPDLLVLADYGQIVPQELLDLPRFGALNLHPSLLPRHRGASPIPAAILAGDKRTGVSLMKMDAGLDSGPLLAQVNRRLRGSETSPEVEDDLSYAAAGLLAVRLGDWLAGTINPTPQDESAATLTRPLRREDGRLDPARSALELDRRVRAYQPWPGSFIGTAAGRLIIWRTAVGASPEGVVPGTLVLTGGGDLALATADGLLELLEVQPAGGRRMLAEELVRGRPQLIGSVIE